MVYDNSGKFKEALNFDGSKNSYLTEFYQGIDIIIIPPLITPIPEASGPITTAHDGSEKVEVVSDTGGDQIPEQGPIHTGHGGGLEGIEVVNDTGGDQILEHDWRDFILTNENKSFVDYQGELDKGDQIDLLKFKERQKVSNGKPNYVDTKTGWIISPDRAGINSHGGSAWKLLDKKGNRIATLDENGNVLRK